MRENKICYNITVRALIDPDIDALCPGKEIKINCSPAGKAIVRDNVWNLGLCHHLGANRSLVGLSSVLVTYSAVSFPFCVRFLNAEANWPIF